MDANQTPRHFLNQCWCVNNYSISAIFWGLKMLNNHLSTASPSRDLSIWEEINYSTVAHFAWYSPNLGFESHQSWVEDYKLFVENNTVSNVAPQMPGLVIARPCGLWPFVLFRLIYSFIYNLIYMHIYSYFYLLICFRPRLFPDTWKYDAYSCHR